MYKRQGETIVEFHAAQGIGMFALLSKELLGMPVGVAASRIASGSVATIFFIFLVLFAALLVAEISILCKQIKIGPEKE